MKHKRVNGFTLPTVLVISLALLVIGLSMFQGASSVRRSIDDQYYNRLASEAAQSGAAYANYCLDQNAQRQSWDTSRTLTNVTDCAGTELSHAHNSLINNDSLRMRFEVGNVSGRPDGASVITSIGTVERVRAGTGAVIATYTKTIKRVARPKHYWQDQVVFGYYNHQDSGIPVDGAFFATIQADGSVWTTGDNRYGQLGNKTTNGTLTPTRYALYDNAFGYQKNAVKLFTSPTGNGYQLFVVARDGTVYASGRQNYAQSGITYQMYSSEVACWSDRSLHLTPLSNPRPFDTTATYSIQVNLPGSTSATFLGRGSDGSVGCMYQSSPDGENATYVSVGGNASFFLTDTNKLYAAGACSDDMLGLGTSCDGHYIAAPQPVALPTPNLSDPNTIPAQEMAVDGTTAYIRMQGGAVYGWGNNSCGQLADGGLNSTSQPKRIGTFGDSSRPKAIQIAFDGGTLYIVADDGNVYTAGCNDYGQAGIGLATSPITTLQKAQIPDNIKHVTTGQYFASFLTDNGKIYSVGNNSSGQLGDGTVSSAVNHPTKFLLPPGVKAVDMYSTAMNPGAGFSSTHVIGDDNKIYSAGDNDWGQLGDGTTTDRSTPVAMHVINGVTIKAGSVLSGGGSTIIVTSTGVVYAVGRNTWGQLGDGTTINRLTPIRSQYLQPRTFNYIF